ncbi:type VI secretion system-associated FHA domain protein TagH [Uliginosibacterium sp. H3]|uniref:Type VI secretion system-associated FHA domain protein TagH n=1 Tax=Uliginosibacterium silvisoli TaxID=3114758 RepID=A0ABU6K5Q8_9RHOO|nr:type VI secretion system-associated FHA domain protein TagH [Uliginosibacterium sp. H3]
MLRISVYQFQGEAPESPLACEFREQGGTIGRDFSNQLALPDQERHMSRVQAEVQFVNGGYQLVDHGSNPTTVNGMPLGKGNAAPLNDGDEIGIAFYTLRVEIPRAAPSFVSSPAPVSRAQPPSPPPAASGDALGLFASASAPASAPRAVAPAPLSMDDPFAALSMPGQVAKPVPKAPPAQPASAASDDPFAVFGAPLPAPSAPPVRSSAPAPMDDPFAAFGAAPKPAAAASPLGIDLPGDPLGVGLQQEGGSLDDLFSLDSKSRSQDPFAGSALADPLFGGPASISGTEDPLALLSGSAPVAPPTERNDAPLMHEAFTPPKVVEDDFLSLDLADDEPAPEPAVVPAAQPVKPLGGMVSWDNEDPGEPASGSARAPQAPAPSAPAAPPPPPPAARPVVEPVASQPVPRPKVVVEGLDNTSSAAVAASGAPGAPQGDANAAALLEALARGLGVTGLKPPGGLTPEFMEHVGKIVREAAHGTIELLLARAVTKREVRAEMTMIVSKNNNPLKFSPDVNFALMQLIAPTGAGFMPPVEAMRDAYDDLRAHQIAFMAGMRGALTGVLGRFKPEDLEARLSDKSFLDSVLPGGRKAKLWDLYEQRFADISREAEDNFHTFFGREFLKAYEEQLDRLHDDR